jgi:hypothetical protein
LIRPEAIFNSQDDFEETNSAENPTENQKKGYDLKNRILRG